MENINNGKKGIIDRVWSFLASVRLAVIIFAVISLTSIVGTIIEQGSAPDNNIKLLSKVFGPSGADTAYKVLAATGFTDMFSSWWFMALLFLFATNLVVCSIERLPGIWKVARTEIRPLGDEAAASMKRRREVVLKADPEKAADIALKALAATGFKGTVKDGQVITEKGRYGRLGVYVTHLSIIVILLGAIIGIKFGFNGSVKILEGMSVSSIQSNSGKDIPLGFELRCDDFEVAFYPDTERPKDYKSILTVLEGGQAVLKQEIGVNSPLRYKGITFYQSTYGFFPNRDALFKFRITSMSGADQKEELKFHGSFKIAGTDVTAKIVDFSPALAVNKAGELFTFTDSMVNPAVQIELSEKGKVKGQQWILKNYKETWRTPYGVIEFVDLWGVQYTGLQVRRDPGVWFVYLGCLLMALGLYAAFFTSHMRIWIKIVQQGKEARLLIMSSVNKNAIAFDRRLDRLEREIARLAENRKQGDK